MSSRQQAKDEATVLVIPQDLLKNIIRQARDTYPYECCGILLGTQRKAGRRVTAIHQAQNKDKKHARDRFEIDPLEYMAVENSVRDHGVEVVGFYHSHPNHAPQPSTFDSVRAWPTSSLSYLIVGVNKSGPPKYKSWVWHPKAERFEVEHLEVATANR